MKKTIKPFDLVMTSAAFKKWDRIKVAMLDEAIVIGNPKQEAGLTTFRVYSVPAPSPYRFVNWLRFSILKLKVYLKWIK